MSERLINGPADAQYTFLMAHGSGAGMDSDFVDAIAVGLAEKGIRVVRFEFPYMQTIRETGKKRPPNAMPILLESFMYEINRLEGNIIIGGKSMGGRVASRILMESKAHACIALGYPFHPPGRPNKLRVEHFEHIAKPMLIIQGMRDPFGKPEENLEEYLSKNMHIHWLSDVDHSFSTRKSSPRTTEQNIAMAVDAMNSFILSL